MATVKCLNCGAPCDKVGHNQYKCMFCGSTFDEDDFATSASPAAVKQPVTVKGESGADVFEKNINGILEISCSGKQGSWAGSGYIISPQGYAITNAHVAADDTDGRPCQRMIVHVCGQDIPAVVVALADDRAGSGNGIDLALIKLLKMPADAVVLSFEQSDAVRNGEPVFVIGNSLGQGTCITSGILSDKARNIRGKSFIMTDCAVNGGNSGGPIFNGRGRVIGTITLQGRSHDGADAEGMNYAIPSKTVMNFLQRNNISVTCEEGEAPEEKGVICPICGGAAIKYRNENMCSACGYRWH